MACFGCGCRERWAKKELSCPNLLRAVGANPKKGRVFLNLMVNETSSTLGDSPGFLGSPGDLDCFGLACAVATTVEVEELALMWQGRARTLSVMDTTPVLAESAATIELAGRAE